MPLASGSSPGDKRREPEKFDFPPADLPMDAYIPKDYISSEGLRLEFYKRMTAVRSLEDVDEIAEEMKDRFGELPTPVKNSLDILKLRLKASGIGIESISSDKRQVTIKFAHGIRLAPDVGFFLKKEFPGVVFAVDRIIISAKTPELLPLLNKILAALPEALEESKQMYLSILK